jgi:enediyne biosynthesis protein E4
LKYQDSNLMSGRSLAAAKSRRDFLFFVPVVAAWAYGLRARVPEHSLQPPVFSEVASKVGLDFHHFNGATGEYFMPEIMGAGVALFDYDNDGALDVFLVQGSLLDIGKGSRQPLAPPPAGWKPGNRLFRNELIKGGKLKFTDVTEQAGLTSAGYGMGVATGDYDNDGFMDLFVSNFGQSILYHNNGDGTFTDVTRTSGLENTAWATSASWCDYDNDGNLDLFVANYLNFTIKDNKRCYAPTGEFEYCTPKMYRPVSARLFHNLGNGKFVDVTEESGIGVLPGPGLGVVCADFNGDGWMDIYVANDGAPNYLWLNQKNGTFKEAGLVSGVAYNGEGVAQGSMGIALGDISNRGAEDLVVTNLTKEAAVFYRHEGRGNFYDGTAEFGLYQPTFPYTGFGTQWFDYDNDGFLDLFIANGAVTRVESLRGSLNPYRQINQLFHNEDGKRFRETTSIAGPAFALSEVSRGAAFGDLNNDGNVDIVVTNNNGPVRLLLNETGKHNGNHWLQIRLRQSRKNLFGLGARIELQQRGRKLLRRVHTDSSYLSANDIRVHFGLGADPHVERVVVYWLDGSTESWEKIHTDTIITLERGTGHQQ